jgi:hypothetical protein
VSLPCWIGLYRPAALCRPGAFRTRHALAVEALLRVRSWFSGPILLLADGADANQSLVLPALDLEVTIACRLRSDARLLEPTPRKARGRRGRKARHGPALPKLARPARRGRGWRLLRAGIDGKRVHLHVHERVAFWPPLRRSIKVVITRDPNNAQHVACLWTTDLAMPAHEVIERFAQRWSVEQLFSVAKVQLGLDSAEVRKERAVVRHAAPCMALVTWVKVWAHRRRAHDRARSFASRIAMPRADTITQTVFASGPRSEASRRIAHDLAAAVTVMPEAA